MSQPKDKIPAHIKPKQFQHPANTNRVILVLQDVQDPRKPSCNFQHSLVAIIFISLMGVLCAAKDWEEIIQAAHGMADWLCQYVDLTAGIPSSKTLKRVMSMIPTKSLESLLQNVKSVIGDIIAIDGKTLRGSRGWDKSDRPLHLLHAWSTELGVCLGQVPVDEKSNEIIALAHTLEKSAGRLEERYYELIDICDLPAAKVWSGSSSVGRVTRKRTKGDKTSVEVCFYITSLDLDIEKFAKSVRKHWGVESGLHLALDVIFDEDKHRYQDRIGAANLSLLRKMALGILTKDSSLKCGRPAKQMRAATSSAYRDHLIKNCF